MLGNVAEWTLDQYDENYFTSIGNNPKDPLIKRTARHPRTLKGGNYQDDASEIAKCRPVKIEPGLEQPRPADTAQPLVECRCAFCWFQDRTAGSSNHRRKK